MLTIPSTVKLFAAVNPVDFRRGIDGLAAIVESEFGIEAMSGDIFIFLNRRANQVRLLFWERDGFCLLTKRLEANRRPLPPASPERLKVILRRLYLDRDIANHREWIDRQPPGPPAESEGSES